MFDTMQKSLGEMLREKLDEPKTFELVTPYDPASELHEACKALATSAISAVFPWLPSLLNASGAADLVTPGHLYFSLASSSDWIEIPDLGCYMSLESCVPPGESIH